MTIHLKQIVVTGQHQAELQTTELSPTELGPKELLIKTERTFISTGTELANYTGREPHVFQPGSWCAYPWRAGYANVGLVKRVGQAVSRANVGDRVFTYGPHASLIRYSEEKLVVVVPEGLPPTLAAASRMAGVATTALLVSQIPTNPWVVVFGLGMVGNLAAQAFCLKGCRVIGVDPLETRRQVAQQCGIAQTIGGKPETVQKRIMEITGGQLADIVVEAVGHSRVATQALTATANFGQLVLLGSPRVPVQGNLTDFLSVVHLRQITVRGALEWGLPIYPVIGDRPSQFSKQQMVFDWIQSGKLNLKPLISHRLKPEQIKEAYEGLLKMPDKYIGVALDWE